MKFNLSSKAFRLIMRFEIFSLMLSFLGIILLYIHLHFYIDKLLYSISISIFRAGLFAGISSFCFGVFFNGIEKKLIK